MLWEISVYLFTFHSCKGIMNELECFKTGGKIWTIKQYYILRKEKFVFINVFSSFWTIAIISMSSSGRHLVFSYCILSLPQWAEHYLWGTCSSIVFRRCLSYSPMPEFLTEWSIFLHLCFREVIKTFCPPYVVKKGSII